MSDMQHSAGTQRTTLSDIDIPFGRLIVIFIKFSPPFPRRSSWRSFSC
jgi:hypothetical protein